MINKKVIVIGAGMAGLAAAHELKKNNVDVSILEARTYTGGRIKSDYSLGIPFPCGAAFLHGLANNPVYHLLKVSHLELKDFKDAPTMIFDHNKNPYSESSLLKNKKYFDQLLIETRSLMKNEKTDRSLLDVVTRLSENKEHIDLTWDFIYLSLFTGIEAKYLSAKYWDQMDEFVDGDHVLLSTFDYILNYLAKDNEILFNTIVNEVNYSGDFVKIHTNQGIFETDIVIVTVPLGVLKNDKIKFCPELSAEKKSAIHNLKMSQLNKIGLLFPTQFWPKDIVTFGYHAKLPHVTPLFLNYTYFFNQPVLLGAVSGADAIALENDGEAAFVEQSMNTLRMLFGNNIPDPVHTITTNWINDPFSFGSYSYIPVGGCGADFDVLAEPVMDKLFFAGEATYRACHSTVQGAYLSGIREAKRILETQ